jgi:hypothetical protein
VYSALGKVAKTLEEKKVVAVRSLAAFHGDCEEPAQATVLRQFEESLDSSSLSQSLVQQAYDRLVHFAGAENA